MIFFPSAPCSHTKLAPWYTLEQRRMKQELRQLEWVWWQTCDKAARTSYKTFMKSCEMAVKVTKKEFYTASSASTSSCPAQLFRIIESLSSLSQEMQKHNDLTINAEVFGSYFVDKILSLCQKLPATIDTICELGGPWPFSGPIISHFTQLFQGLGSAWTVQTILKLYILRKKGKCQPISHTWSTVSQH